MTRDSSPFHSSNSDVAVSIHPPLCRSLELSGGSHRSFGRLLQATESVPIQNHLNQFMLPCRNRPEQSPVAGARKQAEFTNHAWRYERRRETLMARRIPPASAECVSIVRFLNTPGRIMTRPSATRLLVIAGFVIFLSGLTNEAHAQFRTWHDVRGGTIRSRFEGMNENRVIIRHDTKSIEIPFWNLMPDEQRFIAHRFADGETLPPITDAPRDWTLQDGRNIRGQLLKTNASQVVLVIDAVEHSFAWRDLSPDDRKYAKDWPGPVKTPTRPMSAEKQDDGTIQYGPLTFREPKNDRLHLLTNRLAQLVIATIVVIGALLWRFSAER